MTTSSRRTLLGLGLAGGAGIVAGCSSDGEPPPAAAPTSTSPTTTPSSNGEPAASDALVVPDFDPDDWQSVRDQFPLDAALVQMSAYVLSPHTAQVEAAIAHHRDRLNRDTETALLHGYQWEQAVTNAAAVYAGGRPDQYALTDSTTMGLGVMYGGLSLAPGDEILTTTHDFFSTEEALRLLALRSGATVRQVSLYDDPADASVDQMVSRLTDAVTDRTRVVAVTWVHSSTGVRLPIREMARALADARDRVLLCVDGVHGFGAVDADLTDLGCDFLATGTHKWLAGPRGTGIVFARDWEPLTEIIPTFSGSRGGARLSPGGYHDFEHRWALDQAFAFHQRIGRDRVAARIEEQATALKDGLAGIDAITVVTPADPEVSAGIVCVDVRNTLPANAVMDLRALGVVASATPYRQSYLRFGPGLVTSPEDVEATVAAVAEVV